MCPWYKELKLVMRDLPMAQPMRSQETLGDQDIDILDFPTRAASQDNLENGGDQSPGFEGWIPTPPSCIPDDEGLDDLTLDNTLSS